MTTLKRVGGLLLCLSGGTSLILGLSTALLLASTVSGFVGDFFAGLSAISGVLFGGALLWAGRFLSRSARRERRVAEELAILRLAQSRDGQVTATEVARALSMTVARADAVLTEKVDGYRVKAELGSDGSLYYVFPELPAKLHARAKDRSPLFESSDAHLDSGDAYVESSSSAVETGRTSADEKTTEP
ncbi:MAG: hypothetical protein AAF355_06405 [Myxococcota bacterium]